MSREMVWGDVVPLGHFATWACEPNLTIEELTKLVDEVRRDLNSRTGVT